MFVHEQNDLYNTEDCVEIFLGCQNFEEVLKREKYLVLNFGILKKVRKKKEIILEKLKEKEKRRINVKRHKDMYRSLLNYFKPVNLSQNSQNIEFACRSTH